MSLQFGPPICYFFSNLESPSCLYVCNKLWYGIESIISSHSASSKLSGEFMLLHSIHTLANLALKETMPPQSWTSPHVTVKIYIQYSEFRASASCSNILNVKSTVYWIQWKISGQTLFFRVSAELLKHFEWKEMYSTQWTFCGKNSVFESKRKLLKNPEQWKYFQCSILSVYPLGVIRVIWASVVCNLD